MAYEEPRYLAIARILGAWGLKGAMKAEILTDFPERFKTLKQVYLNGEDKPYHVVSARLHGRNVVIQFAEVKTPEAVAPFRNRIVNVPIEDAVKLPADTYFWHQIEGLEVYTEDGRLLGEVAEVLTTGSNDVYVVRPAGQARSRAGANEVLVPAIADVVKQIDLPNRRMVIAPLPGMLSDAEAVIISQDEDTGEE